MPGCCRMEVQYLAPEQLQGFDNYKVCLNRGKLKIASKLKLLSSDMVQSEVQFLLHLISPFISVLLCGHESLEQLCYASVLERCSEGTCKQFQNQISYLSIVLFLATTMFRFLMKEIPYLFAY